MIEDLVFERVGFASKFLSSLMPCQRQWSFAPDKNFEQPPSQNSNSSITFGILKTERILTKISIIPIIGIASGAAKVVMGTLQTVICSIAWLIFKLPAKDNENAQKIFETSQIYVFHGLGNMVAGLVEAIPFVGLISAQFIRNKVERKGFDKQEDKFIPYPEISDRPFIVN